VTHVEKSGEKKDVINVFDDLSINFNEILKLINKNK